MANYNGHYEDSNGNVILPTPHSYTSNIETSTTASQAYTKGQFVTINIPGGLNHLYRVKAAIAAGNTFTVGTNIELINVADINKMLTASNGTIFTIQKYKDGDYS